MGCDQLGSVSFSLAGHGPVVDAMAEAFQLYSAGQCHVEPVQHLALSGGGDFCVKSVGRWGPFSCHSTLLPRLRSVRSRSILSLTYLHVLRHYPKIIIKEGRPAGGISPVAVGLGHLLMRCCWFQNDVPTPEPEPAPTLTRAFGRPCVRGS